MFWRQVNHLVKQNGVSALTSTLGPSLPKLLITNHSPRINRAFFVPRKNPVYFKFIKEFFAIFWRYTHEFTEGFVAIYSSILFEFAVFLAVVGDAH